MIPTAAMNDVLDQLTKERDGLGRALQSMARERDLERRFYEAAMNWFSEADWREFEESDEFKVLDAESNALRQEDAS